MKNLWKSSKISLKMLKTPEIQVCASLKGLFCKAKRGASPPMRRSIQSSKWMAAGRKTSRELQVLCNARALVHLRTPGSLFTSQGLKEIRIYVLIISTIKSLFIAFNRPKISSQYNDNNNNNINSINIYIH